MAFQKNCTWHAIAREELQIRSQSVIFEERRSWRISVAVLANKNVLSSWLNVTQSEKVIFIFWYDYQFGMAFSIRSVMWKKFELLMLQILLWQCYLNLNASYLKLYVTIICIDVKIVPKFCNNFFSNIHMFPMGKSILLNTKLSFIYEMLKKWLKLYSIIHYQEILCYVV